jgi:hypothetical protein
MKEMMMMMMMMMIIIIIMIMIIAELVEYVGRKEYPLINIVRTH